MLLYIMLYIVLAYLMLFAALTNASFLPLISANVFYFHALSLFIDTVCLFNFFISIMHSAFNLFVFANSIFTPL